MSAASFVYTKLGLEELETWTALKKQFSKVRGSMDANPDTFEHHVDELTALGRKIAEIEQRAEVPEDMRSA
tara:strand:+ start:261 stop:473 length:213 start_codon:yes stop_codon:yes gene_type:complete